LRFGALSTHTYTILVRKTKNKVDSWRPKPRMNNNNNNNNN